MSAAAPDQIEEHVGTCFCGAVAIAARGVPLEMGYCHCNSCRSWSGAPVSAYVLWNEADVRVVRGAELIGRYNKFSLSDRQFCTACGGHVMVHHPELRLTHVFPALLPTLAFTPSVHLNYAERVLPIRDGLPKLKDFPLQAGGSGETLPE
jgi:hypothetical protein